MTDIKDTEYKSLEIPEGSKDVISDAFVRVKGKILVITLSENFDKLQILYSFNTNDIPKAIKGLNKKIRTICPEISASELYKVEDLIFRNASILDTDYYNNNTIDKQEQEEGREQRPDVSYEEWQRTLKEKYQILKETTLRNFPDVWQAIEFTLSVKNILHIKGNTLPFAGIILGPPSSSKTLAIEMLRNLKMTYYTDNFTPKSFVSHNTGVPKEQLQEIDMLPMIENKLFLTPELAPTFSAKDEDLLNILGIITRILDGHGYESNSGAYGRRGYDRDIMFTWVGAAVDIPRKVYKHLGQLGPKLYFMRMETQNKSEAELLKELRSSDFNSKKKEVEDSLLDYLKWFDYCPIGEFESNIIKMKVNPEDHEEEALRKIIKLGNLLAHLRGVVQTWETRDTQGSDYAYYVPTIEKPDRAITSLRNLALGHALSQGRTNIIMEDISIIIRTVLSTSPVDRFKVFDLLLKENGKLTTSKIKEKLDFSKPTAGKTMTELKVLGLVSMEKESGENDNSPKSIKLKEEFKWFLSEEFKRLRKGFVPEKFDEKEECKEKYPPPTLKKFDDLEREYDFDSLEHFFWLEFSEIERLQMVDSTIGHRLVEYSRLKNRLVESIISEYVETTEKIVDKLINKLVKEGKLIEPKKWHYYRTKNNNESAAATAAA